ncbi:DHH family phosphoesterase [Paenibacillus wulumuqiensis]|uniref:DHH family phosphoesterase n=1 Tax=Paenibacillus wulumuqiensis TaxID=1567107 RepID=UPI000619F8B9|nr:DHH family phosphoesterase [Paenibacillus wulumuqiensis]
MPNFLLNRWHGYRSVWASLLMLGLVIVLSWFNWIIGLVALCCVILFATVLLRSELAFRRELEEYIAGLSFRIRRVEEEAVSTLPFGLILYDNKYSIEWHNRYIAGLFGRKTLVGTPLEECFVQFQDHYKAAREARKDGTKEVRFELEHEAKTLECIVLPDERLIYVQDITEYADMRSRYDEERLAVGIVFLDNFDEASQGMDDQQRASLIARVATRITDWAKGYRIYVRRLSSERYLLLLNQKSLRELEQSRFVILDEIREMTADLKVPLTLSIGIGFGTKTISELGELAQSSLDMALGRGGDQAAVKADQRLSFYGGKSNAIEKRTRVRARVIAHALRDLMLDSDQVLIMGHKIPDMDVIGAAIGMLKAADMYEVEAYIVLDNVNPSIEKMMDRISRDERLSDRFITPEDALNIMTERTLTVVVDTHKASMTIEPKLVDRSRRVVVVDHHRRGEEFINDAVLVYLEPYASSACELVTELLQYIHDKVQFTTLEATSLLAGITVDTKHFALHTGSRTFEAAGFLRRNGADTVMVQQMMKEDLAEYIAKAEIIKRARVIHDHVALAVTGQGKQVPQLLIAQVADSLLNMNDIYASFVISERMDGLIGISARSFGKMNVQVVMERLGGGGHLTNAAVQLEGGIADAEARLLEVLNQMNEEEGLFE